MTSVYSLLRQHLFLLEYEKGGKNSLSNSFLEINSIQGEYKVFLSPINPSINKKGELIDMFEIEYFQLLKFEDFYLNVYEKCRLVPIC